MTMKLQFNKEKRINYKKNKKKCHVRCLSTTRGFGQLNYNT